MEKKIVVILQDKNYAGFCKKIHSKAWKGFICWSDRAAAEKIGGKYTQYTYTDQFGKVGKRSAH